MTLHQRDRQVDSGESMRRLSRRAVLQRAVLGVAGVGLTSLLAACGDGDDEEPVEGPVVDDPPGDETLEPED